MQPFIQPLIQQLGRRVTVRATGWTNYANVVSPSDQSRGVPTGVRPTARTSKTVVTGAESVCYACFFSHNASVSIQIMDELTEITVRQLINGKMCAESPLCL
jgi:hypothetical protein